MRMNSNQAVSDLQDIEYDPIPEPDARGELHGEALTQAERAAAASPGVNGRLEDAIQRIIARGRVRNTPNVTETRTPDDHFEGEPAGNGRVWRRTNGHWATGVQESISVFAPDADKKSEPEPDWQEFPWEQSPNESPEEHDENIPLQTKRRAVIRHDEDDDSPCLSAAANHAGPSGFRLAKQTHYQTHRLPLNSRWISEKEDAGASSMAFYAVRRKKRPLNRSAARQFIDSMASVEGGSKRDREEEEEDASSRR